MKDQKKKDAEIFSQGPGGKSNPVDSFWRVIARAFKNDTGEEADPEKDAQKIYTHYLNNIGLYGEWAKKYGEQ